MLFRQIVDENNEDKDWTPRRIFRSSFQIECVLDYKLVGAGIYQCEDNFKLIVGTAIALGIAESFCYI